MRVLVLLAAHLDEFRQQSLKYALASVAAQTRRPDAVMLYTSGQAPDKAALEPLAGIQCLLRHSAEQRAQFEHYRDMLEEIRDDDVVMFLDDDDLYAPQKIEACCAAMPEQPGIVQHKTACFGNPFLSELAPGHCVDASEWYAVTYYEYVRFAMHGAVFRAFFSAVDEVGYDCRNPTTDGVLAAWADTASSVKLPSVLYFIRKSSMPRHYKLK